MLDVNQFSPGVMPERATVLPVAVLPGFDEEAPQAFREVVELTEGFRTLLLCENDGESTRTRELLADQGLIRRRRDTRGSPAPWFSLGG